MWTAIRYEKGSEPNYFSVQVRDDSDGRKYWVDVWVDENYHDVDYDWNQYIFTLTDDDDVHRKEVQEDGDNFDEASSEAICLLELEGAIYQDENGDWYITADDEEV